MKTNHTFYLLIALLLAGHLCAARPHAARRDHMPRVRYGLWFHPNRAAVIDGIALGPFNFQSIRQDSMLTVNGINIEAPGIGIFPFPVQGNYITVNGLDLTPFRYGGTNNGLSVAIVSSSYGVHGVSLALLSGVDSPMSGVMVAVMAAGSGRMRGLQVAGFNSAREGKGVMIGLYSCMSERMSGCSLAALNSARVRYEGLQLGLINYTLHLKGVQIGLINYAGNCRRKWMPLIQVSGHKDARLAHRF